MSPYRLSPPRIAAVALFALSCFGLGLYLWSAFGGAVPLRPEGYRVWVPLKSGLILPTNAPVRISGVDVGRVVGRRELPGGRWLVHVELGAEHAPLPADARASARAKTFFGETYLELAPGTSGAPALPEGGTLAWSRVRDPVELEEVFTAFDRPTRRALQQWLAESAVAIGGRGADLNAALGQLAGFERSVNELLRTLRVQDRAVREAVSGTRGVLDALAARRGTLDALAVDGERATRALARRDRELADAVRALPAFEAESARANRALAAFAPRADAVLARLRPAARELSPTLQEAGGLAPELAGALRALDGGVAAARRGLPALDRFVGATGALVAEFPPFLRELNPLVRSVAGARRELTAMVANWTAAMQPFDGRLHYARISLPLSPEVLTNHPRRIGSNRANAYPRPGAPRGQVLDPRACGGPVPRLASADTPYLARVQRYAFGGDGEVRAPPCLTARPSDTAYPHVTRDP